MKIKSILLGMGLAITLLACAPKDADIEKEIAEKLSNTPEVQVSVTDGIATITGICKDDAVKQNAEAVVKDVKGVKSVVNNCEIPAPLPQEETVPVEINSDSALNTSVGEVVKAYNGVSVAVNDGVVTLTGEIKRNQLPSLIQSIQELKPKKVENKLIIK